MLRALLPLTLLLSVQSLAADLSGHARLWVGPGFDSNATRDFVSTGQTTWPDGFLYGVGSVDGTALFERVSLFGAYDIAGRKFITQPLEDTVLQTAELNASVTLTKAISVGVVGRARDRRATDRGYTDLSTAAILDFRPDASLQASVEVGAERFLFNPRFSYSYSGPTATARVKYRMDRKHSLWVNGSYMPRKYNGTTNDNPNLDDEVSILRRDSVVSAGLGYSFRGPFQLSASYGFFEQSSNSYGESQRRHRLQVNAGIRLPWSLMLFASGALQLSQFPDAIYLSPDLQVIEDEENSSFVTLKLVRPLDAHVDLDVRYALYVNVLPQAAFLYLRQVASVGITVHW